AHCRRSHVELGGEALHARPRADPDSGRRADHRREGSPLARDERRRRPLDRQAHSHVLPSAGARERRREAGRRVHGRPVPGDRRRRRLDADLRPRELADPLMRVLVCVKRVPITGGKIVLTDDAQAIRTLHLGFTISPHEECGVEEAVRIVEQHGGESVVLTLGLPEAEEQLRECMAIGADRAIHLVTDEEEWDAQATAAAIVEAVRAEEPFDLPVFGNESADAGGYQVGIRVAYALGLPVVTGLKGLAVENGRIRAEQEAAGGRDVYDVPLPAVATVLEGLNLPRYP